MADALRRYTARSPNVEVSQVDLSGDAVELLADASESAELLVVARRADQDPDARGLGSLTRQLINTARCPILIASPIRKDARDGHSQTAPTRITRKPSSASSAR